MTAGALVLVAFALGPSAWAQEFDAHGTPPIGTLGDVEAPLRVWSPLPVVKGTYSVGGVGEFDRGLLLRHVEGVDEPTPLLEQIIGLNVGGGYAFSKRVAVTATAPVWFSATTGGDVPGGPAFGDVHAWVPVGLVLPDEAGDLGVSVVPWLDLPTGQARHLLGNSGLGGGAFAAVGLGAGPVLLAANLGAERRAWGDIPGKLGGLTVRASAALTVPLGDTLGLSAEAILHQDTNAEGIPDVADIPGSTAELEVAARGRTGMGLTWVAGAGSGVTGGVGTAQFRAWAGLGYAPRSEVVIEVVDNPRTPTPATFAVVDAENAPVAGAEVVVGDAVVGKTDAEGKLALDAVQWSKGVVVRAPGLQPFTVAKPLDGATTVPVALAFLPVPVDFLVRDQNGAVVQGTVGVLDGPTKPAPVAIGPDGKAHLSLAPGSYTIEVASPGLGRQVRAFDIKPGQQAITAEAYLAPDEGDARVGIVVTDELGHPLNAKVVVDGRPIGTTGDTGMIEVADLAVAGHRVELSAEGFQTIEVRDVLVSVDGPGSVRVPLLRLPGSVRVVAHGADGDPVDAVVRFDGPYTRDGAPTADTVRLPPQPLGSVGERIFILRPGVWNAIIASSLYGVQQREVVVPDDDTRLIVVDVQLQTSEDGAGKLTLRVVDPDGNPVDAAQVKLDDKPMGFTSTGGSMAIEGLVPGTRKLLVSAPRFREQPPTDVLVTEGGAERVVTLAWKPGTVHVTARGPAGAVPDATARFVGSEAVPPLPLGVDGDEYTQVAEGTWNVFVASGGFGLQQRSIEIPADSRSLIPVDVVFTAPEGGVSELTVHVVDPEKRPVPGAAVTLDGKERGATSTGGTMTLAELDPGPRKLEVVAQPFVAKSQSFVLKEGALSLDVPLEWAPGATRVVVTGPNGPVDDAVVRLAGPRAEAPRPVGPDGKRLFQLEPGKWSAVIVSPAFGMATQDFEIGASKKGLTTVTVAMDALAAGESELMVRVQDTDGRPVPGAVVSIAGADKGKTGAGGSLLVGSLASGKLAIGVSATGYVPAKVAAATIGAGSQERVFMLEFEPRTVNVVVKDKQGQPLDAEIRFEGPAPVEPKAVGVDGTETFGLRPGTWQILAVTPELGTVRKELKLDKKAQGPQVVEFVLNAKKVDVTQGEVVIREQVQFDFNSTTLRPEAAAILDEVAANILANPRIAKVQIQGHADDIGSVETNFKLSRERAASVRAALITRGVAPERLEAEGFGATRPLAPNIDDAARAKNRRVQFEILD